MYLPSIVFHLDFAYDGTRVAPKASVEDAADAMLLNPEDRYHLQSEGSYRDSAPTRKESLTYVHCDALYCSNGNRSS